MKKIINSVGYVQEAATTDDFTYGPGQADGVPAGTFNAILFTFGSSASVAPECAIAWADADQGAPSVPAVPSGSFVAAQQVMGFNAAFGPDSLLITFDRDMSYLRVAINGTGAQFFSVNFVNVG